ncbi:hypothetical protein G6F69_007651 [Rhizopus microsporus]|nr:hypothetical protein G6F69_007651 [Rhizopus microsporus]
MSIFDARSENGVRAAAYIIGINVFILLVDVFINTILFIVQKDTYIEWCITAASSPLNNQLLSANQGEQQQFNFAIKDFYNCNRTWEDELKFTILCAALIIVLYSYWTFCLFSYAIKLQVNTRAAMLKYYQQGMLPQVPMMLPHVNNGDIIL